MLVNEYLVWILDSFVTFEIKLGDDYQVKSPGKGVASILTKQDENKDKCDVYYVLGIEHTLMCNPNESRWLWGQI